MEGKYDWRRYSVSDYFLSIAKFRVEADMYFQSRALKLFSAIALISTFVLSLSGCVESKTDLHSQHIISDFSKYANYDGWIFQTENLDNHKETSYLWVLFEKPNKIRLKAIDEDFKIAKARNSPDGDLIISNIAAIPGIKRGFLIGVQEIPGKHVYFAFRVDDKNTLYAATAWGNVANVSELVKKVNENTATKEIVKYTPLDETDRQKVLAKVRAQNPQQHEH
ncbi:MAG: hypothetical protein P8Y67_08660 [Alphaproteobacteria bacterium]